MFKQEGDYEKLCIALNYQFRDKNLLAKAITTKSAWLNGLQRKVIGHHEELAFFGDSLLRTVVDEILMTEFPYYKTNKLSQVRDLLVRNANLSEAARKIRLELFILMDPSQWKQCQKGNNPKLLADTMEAVICAIYKDTNNNLKEVERFILSHSHLRAMLIKHKEEEEQNNLSFIKTIQDQDITALQNLIDQGQSPNFLFTHTKYRSVKSLVLPTSIEQREALTPLSFAIYCLEKIASEKHDTATILAIIECLLKNGADPNLHAKDESALIAELFMPRNKKGDLADSSYLSFLQKHKTAFKEFFQETSERIEKKSIIGWEKLTDNVVSLFCKYGANLEVKDHIDSHSLLELAIIHKQQFKSDLLLHNKINLDVTNYAGDTALHLAAKFADKALIDKLLNAGANPIICNNKGKRPFDIAPTNEIKNLLLQAEILRCTPINISQSGETAEEINKRAIDYYKAGLTEESTAKIAQAARLFYMVLKHKLGNPATSQADLIKSFYNLGSAYFQQRKYQEAKPYLDRAYHLSAVTQDISQAENKYFNRLKECKQKLQSRKQHKYIDSRSEVLNIPQPTETSLAAWRTMKELKSEENSIDEQLSFAVSKQSNYRTVERLLKEGANPSTVSASGVPAIHTAIKIYDAAVGLAEATSDMPYNEIGLGSLPAHALQVIQALLLYGADPNQRDQVGRTALHIAATIKGASDIISLLFKSGADPTLSDNKNFYASHYAEDNVIRKLILSKLVLTVIPNNIFATSASQPVAAESLAQPISNLSARSSDTGDNVLKAKSEKGKERLYNSERAVEKRIEVAMTCVPEETKKIEQATPAPSKIKSGPAKTKLCKFFKEGNPSSCNKGNECTFAHGEQAWRKKTDPSKSVRPK